MAQHKCKIFFANIYVTSTSNKLQSFIVGN